MKRRIKILGVLFCLFTLSLLILMFVFNYKIFREIIPEKDFIYLENEYINYEIKELTVMQKVFWDDIIVHWEFISWEDISVIFNKKSKKPSNLIRKDYFNVFWLIFIRSPYSKVYLGLSKNMCKIKNDKFVLWLYVEMWDFYRMLMDDNTKEHWDCRIPLNDKSDSDYWNTCIEKAPHIKFDLN